MTKIGVKFFKITLTLFVTLYYSKQSFFQWNASLSEEFWTFSRFNSYYHRSPQESQKTKKADLAPKTNSNPNFESRFGFLVKFYPIPELGLKICCLERKKMNLYPFFSFLDHCVTGRERQGHGNVLKTDKVFFFPSFSFLL